MKRPYPPLFVLLLLLAPPVTAGESGPLEGSYYEGYFDDGRVENDWFFDRYRDPRSGWLAGDWYRRGPLFAGTYDGGSSADDWFFDAYAPPRGAGPFGG